MRGKADSSFLPSHPFISSSFRGFALGIEDSSFPSIPLKMSLQLADI
jgi:hypothetical protein